MAASLQLFEAFDNKFEEKKEFFFENVNFLRLSSNAAAPHARIAEILITPLVGVLTGGGGGGTNLSIKSSPLLLVRLLLLLQLLLIPHLGLNNQILVFYVLILLTTPTRRTSVGRRSLTKFERQTARAERAERAGSQLILM